MCNSKIATLLQHYNTCVKSPKAISKYFGYEIDDLIFNIQRDYPQFKLIYHKQDGNMLETSSYSLFKHDDIYIIIAYVNEMPEYKYDENKYNLDCLYTRLRHENNDEDDDGYNEDLPFEILIKKNIDYHEYAKNYIYSFAECIKFAHVISDSPKDWVKNHIDYLLSN